MAAKSESVIDAAIARIDAKVADLLRAKDEILAAMVTADAPSESKRSGRPKGSKNKRSTPATTDAGKTDAGTI
jgi:hypothetical protein